MSISEVTVRLNSFSDNWYGARAVIEEELRAISKALERIRISSQLQDEVTEHLLAVHRQWCEACPPAIATGLRGGGPLEKEAHATTHSRVAAAAHTSKNPQKHVPTSTETTDVGLQMNVVGEVDDNNEDIGEPSVPLSMIWSQDEETQSDVNRTLEEASAEKDMEFVKQTLTEWGLEKFWPEFEENEINMEVFLELNHSTLKELIGPLGLRMKFVKNLQELKKLMDIEMPQGNATITTQGKNPLEVTEPSIVPVTTQGTTAATGNPLETTLRQPPAKKSRQECLEFPAKNPLQVTEPSATPVTTPGTAAPGNSLETTLGQPPANRLRQEFDIRAILRRRVEGENLIKEMEEGLLSYKSRKMIVNTLVSHMIEHYGKHVKSHVKLALAKAITEQFPLLDNEDGDGYAAWFTPGRGHHDASGFLENRLRNVRMRDTTKSSKTTPTCPSRLQSSKLGNITDDDADDNLGKLEWLRYNNQPEEQVRKWMNDTVKTRAVTIRTEKKKPVSELVQLYPRLFDTDGMIDQDFRHLFPEAADRLFVKWPTCYGKVLLYVEKQVKNWKQLLHFSGEMDTETKKSNLALQALSLVFPPGCKRGDRGPQRSTLDEASRSFIRREEIGINIRTILEKEEQNQPFVLALGQSEEPEQCFVVFEKNVINCNSLLQAIDVCFKLVYVLDIGFAWECQHTWDFIQKFFYNLGEGKGRNTSVPSVTLFRNFLAKKS